MLEIVLQSFSAHPWPHRCTCGRSYSHLWPCACASALCLCLALPAAPAVDELIASPPPDSTVSRETRPPPNAIGLLLAHACFGFSFSSCVGAGVFAASGPAGAAGAHAHAHADSPAPAPVSASATTTALLPCVFDFFAQEPGQGTRSCLFSTGFCLPACLPAWPYIVSESQTSRLVGCSGHATQVGPKRFGT